MQAVVRSSAAAAGVALVTAGAIAAMPVAQAPAVAVPPIQTHDIQLAALPVGAILIAVLDNQVQNVTTIVQTAETAAVSAGQVVVYTVTSPLTLAQALAVPGTTLLQALAATADSVATPARVGTVAVIRAVENVIGRPLDATVAAINGTLNTSEAVLSAAVGTVRGLLYVPDTFLGNLAATGDIDSAVAAADAQFHTIVDPYWTNVAQNFEAARQNVYDILSQPNPPVEPPYVPTAQAKATDQLALSAAATPADTKSAVSESVTNDKDSSIARTARSPILATKHAPHTFRDGLAGLASNVAASLATSGTPANGPKAAASTAKSATASTAKTTGSRNAGAPKHAAK
jgi:nitrogen regulatory protein PII